MLPCRDLEVVEVFGPASSWQITRIPDINQLNSITREVVKAARETLLLGP